MQLAKHQSAFLPPHPLPKTNHHGRKPQKSSQTCPVATTTPTSHTAIILVDHGSKRPSANNLLETVATQMRGRTNLPIYVAHMELAQPTIADATAVAAAAGASHLLILPFFLAPGRHITSDIPALAAAAAKDHHLSHAIADPLGTHPALVDILLDRAEHL